MHLIVALLFGLALPGLVGAQVAEQPDTSIDAGTRNRVIEGVSQRLHEGYVFPDKATKMARAIQAKMRSGAYNQIASARDFADTLTRDLRAVSHDLHLEVVYQREEVRDEVPDAEPSPEQRRERLAFGRRVNFGFERVERLSGNVGYLEIRSFNFDAADIDSTLTAAMNFLAYTDALVVDVRRNGGGEPSMVAAVCSYLLPSNTLINKFYWRPQNRWDEFRTGAVRGRHYGLTRPVYVLTSDQTFSGAEEFAYDVQTQKRGEVVGDTTGGGAHPGGLRRLTDHFGVWIPSGRAVNPVTGTNWEGTGVRPDVAVRADAALRTAHIRALEWLIRNESEADRKAALQQVRKQVGDSSHVP